MITLRQYMCTSNAALHYSLQGRGYYRMTGRVMEEFGVYNLEVSKLEKVGIRKRAAAKAGALLDKDKSHRQGVVWKE